MANNRTKNVIRNSIASLLQKMVQILSQFALRTAFIYLLGKEYTGISGLFTDILHVLSLMELGLDSSMIFSLYKPLAEHDVRRITALLRFYKRAFSAIGLVVLCAGLACIPFLSYIVKDVPNITEDIRYIFMMYVITSAFSYFYIYKSVLLRADQKSSIVSRWTSIVSIAECILEILALLLLRKFFAYLVIHLLATIGRNILISSISTKRYSEYFAVSDAKLSVDEKKKLFRDLACLTVYNVSGVVINSTDSIFISAFVGTVEVAIIGNFTLILNAARTAVNQIVNATKPSIGNLAATSTDSKQEVVFKRMNYISFWVSCFCCTCLFVLLNPFVAGIWFDASFTIETPIVAVLVANFFIAVMVFPVESFRTANGLFVQGWIRPAIMAVLNIILDFWWGKTWGIFGIFIATTVSRLTTQVWYDPWLVYKMVFKKSVAQYYLKYIEYASITAVSCAAAYYLSSAVMIENKIIDFLFMALISVIIPNLIIIAVFWKTDEFRYVHGFVKKLIKRKSA